jgi:hypothetical protein
MIRDFKNSAKKSSREPARFRSTVDSNGRTIWIADAHRDDGKRFVARAEEKLTAFVELESAIRIALGSMPASNWLSIDSFRLGFGKEFLKTWIVTNWVPNRIDL